LIIFKMEGNVEDFYDLSSSETMLSNYADRDLYFEIFRESGDESSSIVDVSLFSYVKGLKVNFFDLIGCTGIDFKGKQD